MASLKPLATAALRWSSASAHPLLQHATATMSRPAKEFVVSTEFKAEDLR